MSTNDDTGETFTKKELEWACQEAYEAGLCRQDGPDELSEEMRSELSATYDKIHAQAYGEHDDDVRALQCMITKLQDRLSARSRRIDELERSLAPYSEPPGLTGPTHEAYVVYDPAQKKYMAQDHTKNFWVDDLCCAVPFETVSDAHMGTEEVTRAGCGPLEIRRVVVGHVVRVA